MLNMSSMKNFYKRHVPASGCVSIFTLVLVLCLLTMSCNKDEDETPAPPAYQDEIQQPAQPDDPAILPDVEVVIEKYDGDFTPLLTGALANWRIRSHMKYESILGYTCWSDWVNTSYDGVTREGVKGKQVNYQPCNWTFTPESRTPDFSANCSSIWGQYRKGLEIQDGDLYSISSGGSPINFYRYYTVPDLPEAYIKMERKWEVIKIEGSDYAYCSGCTSLEKTTTTTTGIAEESTQKWGYTLGMEWSISATIKFVEAAAKLSATIMQEFSTSITTTEEHTESLKCVGTLPAGKTIIRLQAFREVSTFSLVNQDGTPYGNGVFCPVIATTTQIKNYAWYY